MALTGHRAISGALFSDTDELGSSAYRAGYQAVTQAAPAKTTLSDPEVDLFAATAALKAYYEAGAVIREADRDKRRAKKAIEALKAGIYGGWLLRWKPSTRQVVDLEAVTETYRRLGLGPVPMRNCADSLDVSPLTEHVEL
jgi:hypothetical protein